MGAWVEGERCDNRKLLVAVPDAFTVSDTFVATLALASKEHYKCNQGFSIWGSCHVQDSRLSQT